MANKPLSLTAHRNTRARRERKQLRTDMVRAARDMASRHPVVGYVLIGFDRNANAYASWDSGKVIPLWALPGYVEKCMDMEVQHHSACGYNDDFEPQRSEDKGPGGRGSRDHE